MPNRPKIGEYRHVPGPVLHHGPDGGLRPVQVRKRFRHLGSVVLMYAVLGPLVCAGAALLLQGVAHGAYVPRTAVPQALPPSPSWDNVLFGAGAAETALASALFGYSLWQILWQREVTAEAAGRSASAVFRGSLGTALWLGVLFSGAALLIGLMGLYVRTGPAAQPWFIRLSFSPIAALAIAADYSASGVIPCVVATLGLLAGSATAALVAFTWTRTPGEPILR